MDLSINEPWITSKVRCQNGYVYIDKGFWNSEKQQSDHKREYIGKYDGKTFTPNKTYCRLQAEYEHYVQRYQGSRGGITDISP